MTGATRGSKSLKTQVKTGEEAESRCKGKDGLRQMLSQSGAGVRIPGGLSPREKQTDASISLKHVSASFCEKSQNIINQEVFLCWPSNSGIRKWGWFFTFHCLRNCLVRRLPCTEHRINQVAACHRSEHALTSQD